MVNETTLELPNSAKLMGSSQTLHRDLSTRLKKVLDELIGELADSEIGKLHTQMAAKTKTTRQKAAAHISVSVEPSQVRNVIADQ